MWVLVYSHELYLKWSYGGPHDGDWNIVWELHYCCYQSTEVLDTCGEDSKENGLVDKSEVDESVKSIAIIQLLV